MNLNPYKTPTPDVPDSERVSGCLALAGFALAVGFVFVFFFVIIVTGLVLNGHLGLSTKPQKTHVIAALLLSPLTLAVAQDDAASTENVSVAELKVMQEVISQGQLQERADAIVAAGTFGNNAAPLAPAIVDALADVDDRVKSGAWESALAGHAERALTDIGAAAEPALLEGLNHSNAEVRGRSAVVIGRLKLSSAVERLIELLGDQQRSVAGHASTALGSIGAPAFQPVLDRITALLNSQDDLTPAQLQQRNYACAVLGKFGRSESIETLVRCIEADREDDLTAWAAHALGQSFFQVSSRKLQPSILTEPDMLDRLLALTAHRESSVRNAAAPASTSLSPTTNK